MKKEIKVLKKEKLKLKFSLCKYIINNCFIKCPKVIPNFSFFLNNIFFTYFFINIYEKLYFLNLFKIDFNY